MARLLRAALCIAALLCWVGAAPALDAPRFRRLSTAQGLSHGTVLCMLQDHRGYLWFGTRNGLNRYDGHSFTVFQHEPGNEHSLSHNFVLALCEDRHGNIWVGTFQGGVDCLDPGTGRWRHFRQDPGGNGPSSNEIGKLLEGRDGSIWIGTRSGLDRYLPDRGSFVHYGKNGDRILDDKIWDIVQDPKGDIWCGSTRHGLVRFDPVSGRSTTYRHRAGDPDSLGDDWVKTLCLLPDGTLWVGTFTGHLQRFDPRTGTFASLDWAKGRGRNKGILCTAVDPAGILWFGTYEDGLGRFDPERRELTFLRSDPLDPFSIASNEVWALCIDRTGLVWTGTDAGGVNLFNPHPWFDCYRHHPLVKDSLSHNNVMSLAEDREGKLWVGTLGGGLNRLDRKRGTFERFQHDPGKTGSLGNTLVRSLYCDHQGTVWVGTETTLDRWQPDGRDFRHYASPTGGPFGMVTAMLEDREGRFWVGTGRGLCLLDRRTGASTCYRHDRDRSDSLCDDGIRSLLQDRQGFVWVGTLGGLARLDPAVGTFLNYRNRIGDSTSLGGNSVYGLCETPDGSLWVATEDGGLNVLDPGRKAFHRYFTAHGLPSSTVYGILPDDRGRFWLSTNRGLCRFDPGTGAVANFDASDGLEGNEFAPAAWLRSRDGCMFFGGTHGLNSLLPDRVRPDDAQGPPPGVEITALKVFDRPVALTFRSGRIPEVRLLPRQNFFTVEFAALDFQNPAKNEYAYRLEGVDPDWVTGTRTHGATYTDVAPGDYLFRVKASNGRGAWNDVGASLRIVIVPPFWKTTWFRLLAATAFLAAAVLAQLVHLRNVRTQKERLEALVAERLKEIKVLQGLIPICAQCKQIRDDQGFWHQIEEYISSRSGADFSHGICPKCAKELYPELYRARHGE